MAILELWTKTMLARKLHKRSERSMEESVFLRLLPYEARNGEPGSRF